MAETPHISRRDLLRQGALGTLALGALSATGGALLAACGSGGTSAARRFSSPATTAPSDMGEIKWWLEGNYAPVTVETTAEALEVTGTLPSSLTGTYIRNGSNPLKGTSPHWFLGDGMVHGVRLEAGSASWYRNRWVQTGLYDHGGGLGAAGAPGGTGTLSNVSVVTHAGRVLSLGEVGLPYEISPTDLSTIGPVLDGGGTNSNMTAHPKIDPATGFMHSFGYGFTDPFLEYRVHDAEGRLVSNEVIPVPRSVMMHDFAITSSDVIFMDLPVLFDMKNAIAMVADPASGAVPYRWDPSVGARLGVMPLGGRASQIRWVDIDPCYVYHTVNAVRKGDEIALDVCRLDSTFAPETVASSSTRHRWTINTAGTHLRVADQRFDVPPADLPTIDPRHRGTGWRHSWLAELNSRPGEISFSGVQHFDATSGALDRWSPGGARRAGEPLFVPEGTGEGEGWILSFVYDPSTNRSNLVVLDALNVAKGPVAEVHLPVRVPYGFHASFVTA
ncbi:MAG: carotenoid oxygenase family protein [Actinomycetes bacterium]